MKKISEFEWEIPKQGNMKVPGRIFASEPILNMIKQDQTIQQVKNMACLPGIYKYSIAMPDAHFGYGFPIGGVAALDVKEGGISPGGIGFDINCLSEDSEIIDNHGAKHKIKNLIDGNQVKTMNLGNGQEESAISGFHFNKIEKVYEIETESGQKIKSTLDHPFYTENGMKKLSEVNEPIAINHFTGVEYEQPDENIILDEKSIENKYILEELKKRDLIPLKANNEKLPYILKIMGFNTGDGTAYYSKNKGFCSFYGKPEDLEKIRQDIKKIGYTPSKIYQRDRNHKIDTVYGSIEFQRTEYSIRVTSRSFVKLLELLEMPIGNKTNQEFRVPKFIFNLKKWQKRLYLASLFGAEMSAPKSTKKFNFYSLVLGLNKRTDKIQNCFDFMKDIENLLKEFQIEIGDITSRFSYEKNDRKTHTVRLFVSSKTENLIRFLTKIGFEYNFEKQKKSNLITHYLKLKNNVIKKRERAQNKAISLYNNGTSPSQIYKDLGDEYVNKRFLERSLWENRNEIRVSYDFPGFKEFSENIKQKGLMIFDEIKSIKEIGYQKVYDFNVSHQDHNFIANGFVVSNCGVRLIKTNLSFNDIKGKIPELTEKIFKNIPSGVGKKGKLRLSKSEFLEPIEKGAKWCVDQGYGTKKDLKVLEENGSMKADSDCVSEKAIERGRAQIGTTGAGNHFIEIQKIENILDEKIASVYGLKKDQVVLMVHTGSRGFGHQVASDYIREMERKFPELVDTLPDRQLIYAPSGTETCDEYFQAMKCGANFAWCNRQLITHWARQAFQSVFKDIEMDILYDVAHNIAKKETHKIDNETKQVYVHRKGATRAFPKGHKEIPECYRKVGQPVLIPGSMGTSSYVLCGQQKSMDISFGSTAHGAGRMSSRSEMLRKTRGEDVKRSLEKRNIFVRSASMKCLAEEAPEAYKDIDEVIRISDSLGIAKAVSKNIPIAVVKG